MNGFIEDQEYRLIDFKGLESKNKIVANTVKDLGGSIIIHDVNAFGSALLWASVSGTNFKNQIILSAYVKFFVPVEGVENSDALIPPEFWDSSGIKLEDYSVLNTYPVVPLFSHQLHAISA